MKRLLVLSDLHLAPEGQLNNFFSGPALASFVQAHASADTTLVVDGDFLDLLQVEGRPPVLDIAGAPELIRKSLIAIGRTDWGKKFFTGLRSLLESGGSFVVIPGNHDPELQHPEAPAVLLQALGLSTQQTGLSFHVSGELWQASVGNWKVLVGHGNRGDAFNDISPTAVPEALARGERTLPLCPGSKLVLEVLNEFKQKGYAFVDLLKPEEAVVFLLLYVDPRLALDNLDQALGFGLDSFLRSLMGQLRRGPVLAHGPQVVSHDPTELLAAFVARELSQSERLAPDATVRSWDKMIRGVEGAGPGMLGFHLSLLPLIRLALAGISKHNTFYNRSALDDQEKRVVQELLPSGSGPTVVIRGHSHAARSHSLSDKRVYLNTGTWIDLMDLPQDTSDQAFKTWMDQLRANQVTRKKILTYAEVTPDGGPVLRDWG